VDIGNLIRSCIFFVAGLVTILFPKKVYKFQIYSIEKLHIKYNVERDRKYYPHIGIILIIITPIFISPFLGHRLAVLRHVALSQLVGAHNRRVFGCAHCGPYDQNFRRSIPKTSDTRQSLCKMVVFTILI